MREGRLVRPRTYRITDRGDDAAPSERDTQGEHASYAIVESPAGLSLAEPGSRPEPGSKAILSFAFASEHRVCVGNMFSSGAIISAH